MTVAELITELSKMPQDAEVTFNVHDGDSRYTIQDDTATFGGATIYGE